jgi:hypothetical protein
MSYNFLGNSAVHWRCALPRLPVADVSLRM